MNCHEKIKQRIKSNENISQPEQVFITKKEEDIAMFKVE